MNALGETTTTTYDARGNPLTTTNALGHTEVATYDKLYHFLEPGQLLDDEAGPQLQHDWDRATASSFAAASV